MKNLNDFINEMMEIINDSIISGEMINLDDILSLDDISQGMDLETRRDLIDLYLDLPVPPYEIYKDVIDHLKITEDIFFHSAFWFITEILKAEEDLYLYILYDNCLKTMLIIVGAYRFMEIMKAEWKNTYNK